MKRIKVPKKLIPFNSVITEIALYNKKTLK